MIAIWVGWVSWSGLGRSYRLSMFEHSFNLRTSFQLVKQLMLRGSGWGVHLCDVICSLHGAVAGDAKSSVLASKFWHFWWTGVLALLPNVSRTSQVLPALPASSCFHFLAGHCSTVGLLVHFCWCCRMRFCLAPEMDQDTTGTGRPLLLCCSVLTGPMAQHVPTPSNLCYCQV